MTLLFIGELVFGVLFFATSYAIIHSVEKDSVYD
jgi:hypothetical protein